MAASPRCRNPRPLNPTARLAFLDRNAAASKLRAPVRVFDELRKQVLDVRGKLGHRDEAVAILVAAVQGIDDGDREDAVAEVVELP